MEKPFILKCKNWFEKTKAHYYERSLSDVVHSNYFTMSSIDISALPLPLHKFDFLNSTKLIHVFCNNNKAERPLKAKHASSTPCWTKMGSRRILESRINHSPREVNALFLILGY